MNGTDTREDRYYAVRPHTHVTVLQKWPEHSSLVVITDRSIRNGDQIRCLRAPGLADGRGIWS